MFTQSPIEASIWTAFVGLQQWLVDEVLLSGFFQTAVALWLGFSLMKALYQTGSQGPQRALGRFGILLFFSGIGFGILKSKSGSDFTPKNAAGNSWSESSKVRASDKYQALQNKTGGLTVYLQIQGAASAVSAQMTDAAAKAFRDQGHSQSPYLFLKTMAQTAGATIDDPKALSGLTWMFENCSDRREAQVLGPTSSYSGLFDLGREDCRNRYSEVRRDLSQWAKGRWGTSALNVGNIALSQVGAKLGVVSEEALQNKMIASALVNMSRRRMGQNPSGVNSGALLADANMDPLFGSSTTFFTSVANSLSPAGMTNQLFSTLTGTDYLAADARNQSAALYNRIVQFIPPIRGYAKGLLALAFVFAAAGLCFGTPRFFVAWLGMLVMFTAYEPLSAVLYETTMLFTKAQETTEALGALKDDPLVLSGAAIIDDNLARIQAVYFTLQMGLAAVCGAGGISLFIFSKRIGGGLSEVILSKASSMVQTVALARSGGPR
jgi:hypothetical protein